jgi:hypothetical protein
MAVCPADREVLQMMGDVGTGVVLFLRHAAQLEPL